MRQLRRHGCCAVWAEAAYDTTAPTTFFAEYPAARLGEIIWTKDLKAHPDTSYTESYDMSRESDRGESMLG